MSYGTEIITVEVEDLRSAKWNFKDQASEAMLKKLEASVKRDRSFGVPAVREIQEGGATVYEVMDGNYRLEIIERCGWKSIRVENFGKISKAEAITVARRRNFQWRPIDAKALAHVIADDVIDEIPMEELLDFMPDSEDDLKGFLESDVEPLTFPPIDGGGDDDSGDMVTQKFVMPVDAFRVFKHARSILSNHLSEEGHTLHQNAAVSNGQVIEMLSAELVASYGKKE